MAPRSWTPACCWFRWSAFSLPRILRIRGTLRAIENRLLIDGEFVLRYESEHVGDGLPAGEGAFLACSFWLVDNYVLQGRDAEALKLFDRLLARCNDVGLIAEEFDPSSGRMLGNFPQAYSHVGLINCALSLSRAKGPAEKRATRTAGRPRPRQNSARSGYYGDTPVFSFLSPALSTSHDPQGARPETPKEPRR